MISLFSSVWYTVRDRTENRSKGEDVEDARHTCSRPYCLLLRGSCVAVIARLPRVPLCASDFAVANALDDLGQQESSNREG